MTAKLLFGLIPFFKDKENRQQNQGKPYGIIPAEIFFKIPNREKDKNCQRNNFLHDLKLCRRIKFMPYAIGRNLKTIFKKRYQPTRQNYYPQAGRFKTQVSIPCKRHKNVGNCQK